MTKSVRNRHLETSKAHWVEWATGLVSLLLVLGMIVWIAVEAMTQEDVPPSFDVAVTGGAPVEGGFRLEFDILNQGTTTAAGVLVRAEVVQAQQVIYPAEATLY